MLNNICVLNIERIAAEHGFSVKNVCGDGNCMFHAIALQLLSNKLKSKIGEEKSKELRCSIVEFLKNNDTTPTGEKYSSFLSRVHGDEREITWSTYLASMSKPGTYGDEIILRAVSHCFNVHIHVLSTASPEQFIKYNSPDISEDSSIVYLGFINKDCHYVRLQPKSSEPAMRVMESVSSFNGFSDVYPSCKKFTHKLARLFDKCEFDKEETHRHIISFKEATKRLRTAVENFLSDVEIITRRKVSEFRIGKTSVTSQENLTFDPMKPMTWSKVGGTNKKWREHKKDNYDGLIEVGCVTNELIPKVIKETKTAIPMDHQMYALGMAQALVHHYMVQEPDGRLRNKSIDIGNCSEGKREDKGGIIYVAYKLESENILEEDGLVNTEEEQEVRTATIEFLKMKLEEDGLHFRGTIPDDGNSFFKACSDQLQRLEIPGHTHTELRQMVIPNLKFCSEKEIRSANVATDHWKRYIDTVAKDKENVEDIVVETMAKLLRRQIIVYSRSYTDEISTQEFNEEAKETPLLLAKDKLYYQSLERRHGTPSRLQKSNTSKRAAGTALLDDNASPSKQPKATQEDQTEKGGNEKKTRNVTKKMTKEEKMLILRSYISLSVKSDWNHLAENVYEKRHHVLSREMIKHYEDNLDISTTLKGRIKGYIQNVQRGNRDKETDPEITALMNIVQSNEQAASQRGSQNVHVNVTQR